jgi:hypothetical protein
MDGTHRGGPAVPAPAPPARGEAPAHRESGRAGTGPRGLPGPQRLRAPGRTAPRRDTATVRAAGPCPPGAGRARRAAQADNPDATAAAVLARPELPGPPRKSPTAPADRAARADGPAPSTKAGA